MNAVNRRIFLWASAPVVALSAAVPVFSQALPNGGSVSGSIAFAGAQAGYSFNLQAGQGYQLRLVDTVGGSLYPRMTVRDPGGAVIVVRSGASVATYAAQALVSGTHTVMVEDGNTVPDQTGPFELHYVRAPGANEEGALPSGSSVARTISLGDLDSFTFAAQAGDSYWLRVADTLTNTLYPAMTVYDPTGARVVTRSGQNVASYTAAAAMTGTYTVVIGDGNTFPIATGSYVIHYLRLPGAAENGTLVNGGLRSGNITIGDIDSYSFSMQAGEKYLLRIADPAASTLYPSLSIYNPAGALLATRSGQNVATYGAAAAVTGTYTAVVSDGNTFPSATGAYEVNFIAAPGANAGGALPNGASVTGSIRLGALDSYTFALSAGESYQLSLADTAAGALYPSLTVYDPSGARVTVRSGQNVARYSAVAAMTGTYTVVVADGNTFPSATGPYELHYLRTPGANELGILTSGARISDSLSVGDLDSFTFSLAAGDSYILRITDPVAGPLYPAFTVYDPAGAAVATRSSANVAGYAGRASMPGTYTLVVADGNTFPSATGAYELEFLQAPGMTEFGNLGNRVVTSGRVDLGDVDSYAVQAAAGKTLRIDVRDVAGGQFYPAVTLYDPQGNLLQTRSGQDDASIVQLAPLTGRYTVVVGDGNTFLNGDGPYEIVADIDGAIPGSGCPGQAPPACLSPPSAAAGFTIACPTLTQGCTSPTVIMFGRCANTPVPVPPPIGCGSCGLAVFPSWGTAVGQSVIPPMPPSVAGFSFCVQCGCIASTCISLSGGARIVVSQ